MLNRPEISLLYSGIFALLYLAISANVIRWRFREKRSLGFDHDPESGLFRAIRVHGNFMEYVPFLMLLLVIDEISGRHPTVVHLLGGGLVTGRVLHAAGITFSSKPNLLRQIGMVITFCVMIYLGIGLILKGLE